MRIIKKRLVKIQELKEKPLSVVRYTPTTNIEGKVEYKYDKSIPIPETDEDMAKQVDNGKFRGGKSDEVVDNKRKDLQSVLMSSDAGGFKPLMKLCKQINWQGETYSASKARDKDKLIQVVDRTDFGGKDILLIDDICVYGGTFKGLSKLLKERNCGKLYLAVSHITIQHHLQDSVFEYFDKVFCTNSKYNEYTA